MRNLVKKSINLSVLFLLVVFGVSGFSQPVYAEAFFNAFPISYYSQTNYDLPMIDARNVTQGSGWSNSQSDHDNGVQANPGDVIEFQIYYHNAAANTEQNIAHDVIVSANLPGGERYEHEISATIDSDESSSISSNNSSRGGNIVVHINNGPQTLEFISGSTRHYPQRSTSGQVLSDGNNIVSSGVNIGDIRGCFEFSGFVNFKARVGEDDEPVDQYGLSISKEVRNLSDGESSFRSSTNADPEDRIEFEITVTTSGNARQHDVIVRDIVPNRLSRISNTVKVNGSYQSHGEDLFGSGLDLGDMDAGTTKRITFEARVDSAGVFSEGLTTVTNTANVRSNEVGPRQDNAQVNVSLVKGIQFTQRKTAFNITKGVDATSVSAEPGDVISYTLYFKNTGNTTIDDVVIEDNIHDITELAIITNQGNAVSVNSVIRWAPVDIDPGIEISKTFQVTVRNSNEIPASSDLMMVNIYGNTIRVPVRIVRGATTPPRTGAGEWMLVIAASVLTGSYWAYRRKRDKQVAI